MPVAVVCALLGVSRVVVLQVVAARGRGRRAAHDAGPAPRQGRPGGRGGVHEGPWPARLAAAGGRPGDAGWMVGRRPWRTRCAAKTWSRGESDASNGLTRQDKTAPKFPDLMKRDFTAVGPNASWVGDMTEIPTEAGKLYLATVIDLTPGGCWAPPPGRTPTPNWPRGDQDGCRRPRWRPRAIWRVEEAQRVVFHTDRGSTYTADLHQAVPKAGYPPIDGTARIVLRQCRCRGCSSPAWNGRCCPGTGSPTPAPPMPPCSTGATASTTTPAATAPLA